MTLEEAIQLANNGDQEAMFQLGQYYWKQEKQYQEAQNWYLKGAEAGDVRCMALAALSGNVLAHALRKQWARLPRRSVCGIWRPACPGRRRLVPTAENVIPPVSRLNWVCAVFWLH